MMSEFCEYKSHGLLFYSASSKIMLHKARRINADL